MKTFSILSFLLLFFNMNVFSQITIAGTIATACGEPVPVVDVLLEDLSTIPITEYNTTTSFYGTYHFDGLPTGHDWRLTPSRTTTDLCGIDGDDLTTIFEYLVGDYSVLPSEYEKIAADADDSGVLSGLDMIEIQRFILAIDNGFPVNWRFVDAGFTFPPPLPSINVNHAYPNTILHDNLNQDALSSDFTAIKTGDVNCTYDNSCDESYSCSLGCRVDVIPSVAICPAELVGTQLAIPVRYYAPNGVTDEFFELVRFNINVFGQNVSCVSIDETATEASGPNVSVNNNLVEYNASNVTLTNDQVLFYIIVDGSTNCCFSPEISNARFFYEIPANVVNANECDGDEFCIPSTEIRGTVETLTGGTRPIENVAIRIVDELGNAYCEGLVTDQDGNYSCDVLPDLTYTISPYRNDAHCAGVTLADPQLLNSYLQGLTTLDPYQQISADVNNDATLDYTDHLSMVSMAHCLEDEFANNTSWRFVDATYNWYLSANKPPAQDYPEEIVVTSSGSNLGSFDRADFIGMKIGDVSGSCPDCGACCGMEPPGEGLSRSSENNAIDQEGKLWDDLEMLTQVELTTAQLLALRSGHLVVKVYPNPFVENISLEIFSMYTSDATLRLFDVTGKAITQSELVLGEGMNTYELHNLGDLPKGIYFSQIRVGSHTMVNKLVKF